MRTLILIIGLITALLLAGCSVNLVKDAASQKPVPIEEPGNGLIEDIARSCAEPQKVISGECCIDADANSVCDKNEIEAACGDSVCSPAENECTCPGDCGNCEAKDAGVCKTSACENNICVAKLDAQCCGDAQCRDGETCDTCFQDCCTISSFSSTEKLNLVNFPGIAKGISIVVGDKAPPEDVVTAEDILTKIASEGLDVGNGMLASEIELGKKSYIIVGNPCDNKAAAELFKTDIFLNANTPACQIFSPGRGMVKIMMTSDTTTAIYVGGYSPAETEQAARRLLDYQKNPLVGIEERI